MKVLQRTAAAARAFGSVGERWGVLGRRGCDGRAAALSCASVTVVVVVVVVVIMMIIMIMAIFIDTAAMHSPSAS